MSDSVLSKEQYKFLRKIKKHGGIARNSLSAKERDICRYLLSEECINKAKSNSAPWQLSYNQDRLPEHITISQRGEAQVYTFRSTFYKWWIPVVISIVAIIVSIVLPIILKFV